MPVRREYIADLYRNVLGREGSDDEISGHENNPGGEQGLFDLFNSVAGNQNDGDTNNQATVGSTQQQEYQREYTPSAPQDTGSGGGGEAPAPLPTGGLTGYGGTNTGGGGGESGGGRPQITGGITPRHAYGGFDTNRQQDTRASAKDAFLSISNNAPPPPYNDRAALGAWFKQYIQPGMDALGHRVISSSEDGFTYTNHEGTFYVDFAVNAGAALGSMQQNLAWQARPVGGANTTGPGTSTGTGTGTGGGSGSSSGSGSGSGSTQSTMQNIGQLYGQLGKQYTGPSSPGVMQGPVQQVGQDPLSQLISGGLADMILNQGMTREGQDTFASLRDLIGRGGRLPDTVPQDTVPRPTRRTPDLAAREREQMLRFESARELMAKGERTATNDARAALANRGLLSEPGNASGAEMSTIGRVNTRNAEEFSRNLRDMLSDTMRTNAAEDLSYAQIDSNEQMAYDKLMTDIGLAKDDANNTRLNQALGLATGMASTQAQALLATLGAGTDRQNALSQIALQSLNQNMAWNQFLAEFGLKRDEVLYKMESGNIDDIMPYLQMFMQLAQSTARGFV